MIAIGEYLAGVTDNLTHYFQAKNCMLLKVTYKPVKKYKPTITSVLNLLEIFEDS